MKQPSQLDADPRWRRLNDADWVCSSCGVPHRGLPDLFCAKPEHWRGSEEYLPNSMVNSLSHFLSEDFCIRDGKDFFVRSVLEIPILESGGADFAFGVWTNISEKNFRIYVDAFDSEARDGLGPWFGWFSNRLKGYPETINLKCQLHPRAGRRQRPWIELESEDHPLAIEQRSGISLDRILELHALNGHDFRKALLH